MLCTVYTLTALLNGKMMENGYPQLNSPKPPAVVE